MFIPNKSIFTRLHVLVELKCDDPQQVLLFIFTRNTSFHPLRDMYSAKRCQ